MAGGAAQRRHSTVNVSQEQLASARAAVRLVSRVTGRRYTMANFVREAVALQLRRICEEYNEGRPIAPDPEPLKTRGKLL